jgi:hypothetical protein
MVACLPHGCKTVLVTIPQKKSIWEKKKVWLITLYEVVINNQYVFAKND